MNDWEQFLREVSWVRPARGQRHDGRGPTAGPRAVRDLYGTMQHEGATHGIMITTSGYGPGSEAFANGKPLHLIDGHGLIPICQEHGIPARILGLRLGTRKSR